MDGKIKLKTAKILLKARHDTITQLRKVNRRKSEIDVKIRDAKKQITQAALEVETLNIPDGGHVIPKRYPLN